jgi:hypothetical protein
LEYHVSFPSFYPTLSLLQKCMHPNNLLKTAAESPAGVLLCGTYCNMLWHGWTADPTQRPPAGDSAAVLQNYICAYISAFTGWLFLLFRGFWDISHYGYFIRILLAACKIFFFFPSSPAPLRPSYKKSTTPPRERQRRHAP